MSPPENSEKTIEKPDVNALQSSTETQAGTPTVNLRDADEALAYLFAHPKASDISIEGIAILQDPLQRKKLIRKIDLTIPTLLAAVYFLQYLDKTTLSYAAVMGIREDTHLVGQNYAVVSMLFYLGFLIAEFPTQYLAQHISRLALYLRVNIMLWGLVLGCHAACTTYIGLAICRFLLGVFESCVAPILVLIVSMGYRKEEQGHRVSWFYVCNSLTKVFGGILAYGISFANTNFASWRIFFVVIGRLTMIVGLLVFMFLPDSLVKAKRFNDAAKVAVLMRVKDNQSSIPNGGLSNFSSILLTTFGYSSREALILSAPGEAIGVICVLGVGYLSDKWNDRSLVMLLCIAPTILGGGLMIGLDPNSTPKNKAGLLAASFMTGTFEAAFMLLLAWNASNIAGHTKKVTLNSMTLVSFAVGNILGTQTFQQSQAPGYISGKISIIATLGALCFMIFILRWFNDKLNKGNEMLLAGMEESKTVELRESMAFRDETDRKNVFFRYTH